MVTENSSLFWPLENIMAIFCAVPSVFKQKGEELGRQPYIIYVLEGEKILVIKEHHDKMCLNLLKTLLESTPSNFLSL